MRFALLFEVSILASLFAAASPAVAQSSLSTPASTFLSGDLLSGSTSSAEGSSSSAEVASGFANASDGRVTSARFGGQPDRAQPEGEAPLNRPFRSLSLTAKVGTGGIGFDVATPIAPRLKVRAGAQFYSQDFGFTTDGLNAKASLHLRNVALMLDVFPFHNGFHLSPGVTLNNDNYITGMVNVPGGQTFSLGDTDFLSSPLDPVGGAARIRLGDKVAPRFTLGWEDILRHKAGHFSLPVEFGFQYSHAPVVTLALSGTACYQQGCAKVSTPVILLAAELEAIKLEKDLQPLRFYPIASVGVRYTFGR